MLKPPISCKEAQLSALCQPWSIMLQVCSLDMHRAQALPEAQVARLATQ